MGQRWKTIILLISVEFPIANDTISTSFATPSLHRHKRTHVTGTCLLDNASRSDEELTHG